MIYTINDNRISDDEFADYIDSYAGADDMIYDAINKCNNLTDLIQLKEEVRGHTIKVAISYTHSWEKATVVHNDGFCSEQFRCSECGISASIFENVKCLYNIKKVNDKMPTYNTHNHYLKFVCSLVKETKANNKAFCLECGLPEQLSSDECYFNDV